MPNSEMSEERVFAFELTVVGTGWQRTINARTLGAAKYEYWRDVIDAII